MESTKSLSIREDYFFIYGKEVKQEQPQKLVISPQLLFRLEDRSKLPAGFRRLSFVMSFDWALGKVVERVFSVEHGLEQFLNWLLLHHVPGAHYGTQGPRNRL